MRQISRFCSFKLIFSVFFFLSTILYGIPSSAAADGTSFRFCQSENLATRSVFNPLEDHQIKDVALLEYLLVCHLKKDPSLLSEKRMPLQEKVSEQTSAEFDFARIGKIGKNSYLVPCKVNDEPYAGFITYNESAGDYMVTIYTESEIESAESALAHAERAESKDIKSYINHEEKTDAFLKKLPPDCRVVINGAADESVKRILGFLNAIGAEKLADDTKEFIGHNRLFRVIGQDEVPTEEIDHASNIAIHVKDRGEQREQRLEFEKAVIHEILAKAGIPASINNAHDVKEAVNASYSAYLGSQKLDSAAKFNPAPLIQKIFLRSGRKIDLTECGFVDLNKQRDRDFTLSSGGYSQDLLFPEESALDRAIDNIEKWKKRNKNDPDYFNSRTGKNPFWTKLQQKALEVYNTQKIYLLPLKDRVEFCMEVFDGKNFSNVRHIVRLVLNRLEVDMESSAKILTSKNCHILANLLSNIGNNYSILDNKNIAFAINSILFDSSPKERRIIELEWFIGEIEKELETPGSGELPLGITIQDIHGGQRRASSLVGFALGLKPDIYKYIENVRDLERELDEANINFRDMDVRFVGFNDLYDRGMDPVGAFELVSWLNESGKAKHFMGNHDFWRAMAGIGIDKLFDERGFDYTKKEHKNDHVAYWSREARKHAGWGNIEMDQINEKRFNDEIERVNGILGLYGLPGLDGIDLAQKRGEFDAELKRIKKTNAEIRTRNEENKDAPDYERQPELPLPEIFEKTLAYLKQEISRRNLQIEKSNKTCSFDIKLLKFPIVDMENYWQDHEIIERTLWELQNFRLFYVDIFGSLHIHNVLPFDYDNKKIDVQYRGVTGLPALELMREDIRAFFEPLKTIPDSNTFREKLWDELGDALTIINSWYSDQTASAKPVSVKKFVDRGGPVMFGKELMGWPVDEFSARPVSLFMILGHNPLKKFGKGKTPLPVINIFPGTGVSLLQIDMEMSEGYSNMGAVLTFLKRDKRDKITGMRIWGYPEPGSEEIEDLTFKYIHGIDKEQREFLDTLADGEKFMRWFRLRALEEISAISDEVISVARKEGRADKAEKLAGIKKEAELKLGRIKSSPAEVLVDMLRNKSTVKGAPRNPVSHELRFLYRLGLLDRIIEEGASYRYELNGMVSGLEEKGILEICDRVPELDGRHVPDEDISRIRARVIKIISEKIHLANLELAPAISKEKTLWYVIPRSLVPESQQAALKKLTQALRKTGSTERILLVESDDDIVSAAAGLKKPETIVLAACSDREVFDSLAENNIKGLMFQGKLGEFRQFEGVLAALRAYQNNDITSLKNIYRLITGQYPPLIDDPAEFARAVVFYLPPVEGLDYEQIRELNKNMVLLIQSA